jgi:hypothetical protein
MNPRIMPSFASGHRNARLKFEAFKSASSMSVRECFFLDIAERIKPRKAIQKLQRKINENNS